MSGLSSPSSRRNREPILHALQALLPERGRAVEIASGTGEHALHFTRGLPGWTWQPTDVEAGALASVAAWREEGPPGFLAPRALDVRDADWGVGAVDLVFCANMVHISPWSCAEGLVAGAARHLAPGGRLVLYGPFRVGGDHTAPSNATFDASLRERDPSWGVRDLEAVQALAEAAGLAFEARVDMPANNMVLSFRAPAS